MFRPFRKQVFAEVDPQSWFGLFAPKGTPKAISDKVQKDVATVFTDKAFLDRSINALAFGPVVSTPEEFAKFIAEDLAYKGRLISVTGIKAE